MLTISAADTLWAATLSAKFESEKAPVAISRVPDRGDLSIFEDIDWEEPERFIA